jgi:2,4-diketo-3-deoxy-L-fuconate hydrolase
MKIAALRHQGAERLALVEGDGLRLLPPEAGDLLDVIGNGTGGLVAGSETTAIADAELLPPLRRFRRDILCAGWNYWDHFEEGRGRRDGQDVDRPEHPTFFTKGPDTVIGPRDDIAYDPAISAKWDYEVEMALIIGTEGRSIAPENALEHVFGYCLANDVSQRDLQRAHGGQWLKGKSIDGTMPLGPFVATADEVDPQNVTIQCILNGEVVQSASTRLMAFSVAQLISELSFGMTLRPGDVVLTGTPAGVGNARTPQLFLKEGDTLVTRSPELGEMRNVMCAVDLHSPKGSRSS